MDMIRIIICLIIASAIIFGALRGERFFSSTAFCTSCHTMGYAYEELKKSSHYGRLGIDPQCGDCHLPSGFLNRLKAHALSGVTDLYGEFTKDLSTYEKFSLYRDELAERARRNLKNWDSSPCRTCHKNPRPASDNGKAAHRMLKEGKTCVDCHRNLHYSPLKTAG